MKKTIVRGLLLGLIAVFVWVLYVWAFSFGISTRLTCAEGCVIVNPGTYYQSLLVRWVPVQTVINGQVRSEFCQGWNGKDQRSFTITVKWRKQILITSFPPHWVDTNVYHSESTSRTLNMPEWCKPLASASVKVGVCSWNDETGSRTPVTVTIDHAIVHSSMGNLTSSTTLSMPPGHNAWPWDHVEGWRGSGTLVFNVSDCTPPEAKAKVKVGPCEWSEEKGSRSDVTITIDHAVVHPPDEEDITESKVIEDMPTGHYRWPWNAKSGYRGSGVLDFEVDDCTPDKASVSAQVGTCTWSEENGSRSDVTLTLVHAVVHPPDEEDITESTILKGMSTGSYAWPWEAKPGYVGSGDLEFEVKDCTPPEPEEASVSVSVGPCTWDEEKGSRSDVTLNLVHAVVHPPDEEDITESKVLKDMPTGSYAWPWEGVDGYTGSGILTFEVKDCTPGEADYKYSVSETCSNGTRTLTVDLIGELTLTALDPNGNPLYVFTEDSSADVPAGVTIALIAKPGEGYVLIGPARVDVPVASCNKTGGRPRIDLGNMVKITSTAYPNHYCYVTAPREVEPGVDSMTRVCESAGSWLAGKPLPDFIDFVNFVSRIVAHGEVYFTGYDDPWGYWEGDPGDRIRAPVLPIDGIGRYLLNVYCATNGEQVPSALCN